MRNPVALVSLVASLVLVAAPWANGDPAPPPEVIRRTGLAYCVETGKHLYTEHHVQRWRGEQQLSSAVRYTTPDGKLLAEKELTYRERHQLRPAFRFVDVRTGLVEQARWRGNELELRTRESKDDDYESAKIEVKDALVVDAGFDHAVLKNWSALLRGDEVTFRFAVPAKLDWYTVSVQRTGLVNRKGRTLLRLTMDLDSVLSWFTTEVVLHYDVEGRYLAEYAGISNLLDADGETQQTRIVFDAPRRQAPAQRPQ